MESQHGGGSEIPSSTLAEDLLTVLNCCKKRAQLSLKMYPTHPRIFGQHKLDLTWGGRTQSWVGREVGMNPGRFGEGEWIWSNVQNFQRIKKQSEPKQLRGGKGFFHLTAQVIIHHQRSQGRNKSRSMETCGSWLTPWLRIRPGPLYAAGWKGVGPPTPSLKPPVHRQGHRPVP